MPTKGRGSARKCGRPYSTLPLTASGAQLAYSGSFEDNPASFEVSRSIGYVENGDEIRDREGKPARLVRLKLTREVWEQSRRDDIEFVGLEGCLDWFGAGDTSTQPF